MMIKTMTALALVAGMALAAPAFAQEMTNGDTGTVVDGHGGGGSIANRYHADGPGAGAFRTQAPDGTCYLHTADKTIVVRCSR
jgi:hypothetical protein